MSRQILFLKRISFIWLCFTLAAQTIQAQFEEGKSTVSVGKIVCSATLPASVKATYTAQSGELAGRRIVNIVRFKLNEVATNGTGQPYKYYKSGFTAVAHLRIFVWSSASNVSPDQTISQDLTVTYNPAAGTKYNPVVYRTFTSVYEKDSVVLDGVTITGLSNGWTDANVLPLLTVENEMQILRYFNLSATKVASFAAPVYDGTNHADQLSASWTFPSDTHENSSQLEYAWVENETAGYYTTNGSFDMAKLFRENSTRIDLDYNATGYSYNVPLLFDADPSKGGGTLYYRVRSALRKNDGSMVTGTWSAVQTFANNGHQTNFNWQSKTSFAENGKSKTVVQYFDGTLRPRQTVTKDNSTGNVTIAETIYDMQGRPNVQILPTPTVSTAIKYFSDFNRFAGQTTNDDPSKYFDLAVAGNQCVGAPKLDLSRGNGQYYSTNNPWKTTEASAQYVPDANGYAYAETRYTDDPTQRISVQGGVGQAFQIGNGHETKYYYGKPGQQELDALFGTEAGDASHYFKNMVQDANGQMSVSYVDMHGRTVATALAGDAPAQMADISGNTSYYPAAGTLTNSLLTPATNIIKGESIQSVSTILVSTNGTYNFTYQLTPPILKQLNCNQQQICFDCKYNLEISIRREDCSDAAPIVKHYNNLQITPAGQVCTTPMGFTGDNGTTPATTITFSQALTPGSWVVRKTLSIDAASFQAREDSARKAFLCKAQQTITDSVFASLSSTSGCSTTQPQQCSACLAQLGTYSNYKAKFIASVGGSTNLTDAVIHAQYSQDSLACAELCGTVTNPVFGTLAQLRAQMLNDMRPYTGQYALPTDSFTNSQLQAKYNIFATSYTGSFGSFGTKPFYKNPITETGTATYYTDADGNADNSIYPNGNSANHSLLNSITKNNFTSIFNPGWADRLIYYHPEYSKLHFAETTLKSSYDWLDKVLQCNTYAQASTAGYLAPLSSDPYFTYNGNQGYVHTDWTAMNHYLTVNVNINDNTQAYSIWQIANGTALCDTTLPDPQRQTCITGKSYSGLDASANTTAKKDAVWRAFRNLYLGYRNDMLLKYIDAQQAATLSASAMAELQNEDKQLRFATNQTQASQNGWTWWNDATNTTSVNAATLASQANAYVAANTVDGCVAQRPFWQSRLMQCEQLQQYLLNKTHTDSVKVTTIINAILDSMVMVCHNSMDDNNPMGASNVNPANLPVKPANFEDIINHVFAQYGIATVAGNNYFCNPYTIDEPGPYNNNAPLFVNYKGSADSCNCSQFATIRTTAKAAGVDTSSLTQMNIYLQANYNDTLTAALWQGLRTCSSHSVWFTDTCYWRSASTGESALMAADKSAATVAVIPPCQETLEVNGSPHISSLTVTQPAASAPAGSNQSMVLTYTLPSGATGSTLFMDGDPYDPVTGTAFIVLPMAPCGNHSFFIQSAFTTTDCYGNPTTTYTTSNTVFQTMCWIKDSCVHLSVPISLNAYVPIPPFLNCGYIKPCVTCATLQGYTDEFRALYPAYSSVPHTDGGTGTDTAAAKQNALWARYLNYKTGFNKTANEYAAAFMSCGSGGGTADLVIFDRYAQPPHGQTAPYVYSAAASVTFSEGFSSLDNDNFEASLGATYNSSDAVCNLDKPVTYIPMPDTTHKNTCAQVQQQASYIGALIYQRMQDSLIANFDSLYRDKCLSAQSAEVFYAAYQPKEYHYTLYYYDQAGNLVKTMPPAAVKPNYGATYLSQVVTSRASGTQKRNGTNNENMATQYRYNSLNVVTAQKTPDAGISHFWYDRLGRLAVSQNAVQSANNTYSYTMYDVLGRITEVGQKPQATAMTQTISQDDASLQGWLANLSTGGAKTQITRTFYDVPADPSKAPVIGQVNLRNRVSYTSVFDVDNTDLSAYRTATFYSYDPHGNVDTLVQDYGTASAMGTTGSNRYKTIIYDYDLISGKVNQVQYNPRKADGFYHRYSYDAENRLVNVTTSRDSVWWQNDAAYAYYRHGPLARTQLGDLQVQGVDYAYTLQGWLKHINPSNVNDAATGDLYDTDGTGTNPLFERDAFKLNLNYYTDGTYADYKPVAPPTGYVQGNSLPATAKNNLYNGNIASMAVNIRALQGTPLTAGGGFIYNYQYDQLNRITSMGAWAADGSFVPTGTSPLSDYAEQYSYDPNGNIKTLSRNGTGTTTAMDNLTYSYTANTNKLDHIADAVAAANYTTDIDNQSSGNYTYDAIGNLTSDAQAGITNISWSVYGKILSITKGGSTITYTYDAAGNRISKTVGSITTWYVRDAQGNVMAVYTKGDASINSGALSQTEADIYGSSRLGVLNNSVNCTSLGLSLVRTFTRGDKIFELSNHLGNVLVTISDKKLQHTTNNTAVDYYLPDVIDAQDYYSGGMQMPGRIYTASTSNYRYGFNGQEKSSEINSDGNLYTAEYWEYDSRIGRRWNIDPKQKVYESPYMCFSGNPVLFSDPNGDVSGDPTKIYHRTSSANAASISQNGFDPGKSNRNGFTYFSTTPEGGSIGTAAASGNTVVNATLDISNAKTISKQQMTGWFSEGFSEANKQLNTKYSSMAEVPKELQSKYQSIADGVRNTKLADFMKADGGTIYNIAGKNTIAVAESAISNVKITGFSGSGAGELAQMISRPALNGESAAALARYGQAASTIKWGGRACLAIAVAADVYEIYQSDNVMRTMNIKVGGWAGALAGASYGAGIGAGGGTIVPGAGNVVGGIGGGIIGGVIGYWAGSTVTRIAYDYLFTKGVSAK